MSNCISNTDSVIDSRDIIARIRELEELLDDEYEDYKKGFQTDYDLYIDEYVKEDDNDQPPFFDEWMDMNHLKEWSFSEWRDDQVSDFGNNKDEIEELEALKDLQSEASYSTDWKYGETLIHENYFETYARELASDIGAYDDRNVKWPFTCIDWEAAAEELKQDYSEVDFDGETYYIRS